MATREPFGRLLAVGLTFLIAVAGVDQHRDERGPAADHRHFSALGELRRLGPVVGRVALGLLLNIGLRPGFEVSCRAVPVCGKVGWVECSEPTDAAISAAFGGSSARPTLPCLPRLQSLAFITSSLDAFDLDVVQRESPGGAEDADADDRLAGPGGHLIRARLRSASRKCLARVPPASPGVGPVLIV